MECPAFLKEIMYGSLLKKEHHVESMMMFSVDVFQTRHPNFLFQNDVFS